MAKVKEQHWEADPSFSILTTTISGLDFFDLIACQIRNLGYTLVEITELGSIESLVPKGTSSNMALSRVSDKKYLLTRGEITALINEDTKEVFAIPSLEIWRNRPNLRLQAERFVRDLSALLLVLSNKLALHGNVLSHKSGEAFAILGQSGAGKSTLSFALTQRGATLLADDLCALDLSNNELVYRKSNLHLSVESYEKLENKKAAVEQKGKFSLKFNLPKEPPGAPCYIKRVFKLIHSDTPAKLMRLNPSVAIFDLLKCSVIDPRIIGITMENYLQERLSLFETCEVWALSYPKRFDQIDMACELISKF